VSDDDDETPDVLARVECGFRVRRRSRFVTFA